MRNVLRLGELTSIASMVLLMGFAPPARAEPAQAPRALPESPPPLGSMTLTDSPLIVNTHPLTVDSWSRDSNDASIRLHFTSPAPACSGVHASTHESADTVTVDLRGGWLPEAVGRVCPMIVVRGTLEVPLDDPVGNRQVVSS